MDLRKLFQTSTATKPQPSAQHHFDAPDFVTARDRADPDFLCQGSEKAAKRAPPTQEAAKTKKKKRKKAIEIASVKEAAAEAPSPWIHRCVLEPKVA